MATGFTGARTSGEERAALVTVPPHSHAQRLVDHGLSSSPARARYDDGFGEAVMGHDRSHVALPLGELLSFHAVGLSLRLCPLRRTTDALCTTVVSAAGTLVASAEACMASVALPVDANAHRLLYAKNIALSRMPLAGFDLQPKASAKFPGTLFMNLRPGYPGCSFVLGRFPHRRRGGRSGTLGYISLSIRAMAYIMGTGDQVVRNRKGRKVPCGLGLIRRSLDVARSRLSFRGRVTRFPENGSHP